MLNYRNINKNSRLYKFQYPGCHVFYSFVKCHHRGESGDRYRQSLCILHNFLYNNLNKSSNFKKNEAQIKLYFCCYPYLRECLHGKTNSRIPGNTRALEVQVLVALIYLSTHLSTKISRKVW